MSYTTADINIAILDDYQNVALTMANWSCLRSNASIVVFSDTIIAPDALVARLLPFDIICVMRERTPLPRSIIERLPRLKLIVSTGPKNASIDHDATNELGVTVENTRGSLIAPTELTWALIQASARRIAIEAASVRSGGWQHTVGRELAGKTLGILGLGHIGTKIAKIASIFEMNVIAYSGHVAHDEAVEAGVALVTFDDLFRTADILTIHLALADGTRGTVDAVALGKMKPDAWLINTSRGQIIDEAALIRALEEGWIGGAALDVFDAEPLPQDHPFRKLANVLATPHLGYVSHQQYAVWYGDTVEIISAWIRDRSGEN